MRTTAAVVATIVISITLPALAQVESGGRKKPKPTTTPQAVQAGDSSQATQPLEADVAGQAVALLAGWQTEAARELLESSQSKGASTTDLETARALLLAEQGETSKALALFDKASAKEPKSPAPDYWRGEVLYWGNDRAAAKQAWNEAYRRASSRAAAQPADATAHYFLGAALVRLGKPEEAQDALQTALGGGFPPAMVHHQIGLAHLMLKQYRQAKDALTKAIESDPLLAPAFFYRGLAWEKLDRKDNMLIDMDQVVTLAPNAPEAKKAGAILAASGR